MSTQNPSSDPGKNPFGACFLLRDYSWFRLLGDETVHQSHPFVHDNRDGDDKQASTDGANFSRGGGAGDQPNGNDQKRRHSVAFSRQNTPPADCDRHKPKSWNAAVEISKEVASEDNKEDLEVNKEYIIREDIKDIKNVILNIKKDILDMKEDIRGLRKDLIQDIKDIIKGKVNEQSEDDGNESNSKLEIIDQSEAYSEKDDDFMFDHTKIILRRGNEYFSAITKRPAPELKDLDIASLDLTRIPPEHFRPNLKQGITKATEHMTDVYIKRPGLVDWDPSDENPERIADLVLQKAEIYEILKQHPHPNIAQYFGCLIKDDRIAGFCLAKYSEKLSEKLVGRTVAERELYYEGIERGVRHLHQLGLIHNDLNPSNIMTDGDTPVIIDFDSCRPNGANLGAKAGTFEWELEEAQFATPENDFYSLGKLRRFIMGGE